MIFVAFKDKVFRLDTKDAKFSNENKKATINDIAVDDRIEGRGIRHENNDIIKAENIFIKSENQIGNEPESVDSVTGAQAQNRIQELK